VIDGTPAEERRVQDARRALDHAATAMFELAFSLESLTGVACFTA
jgi:hypothetical protein